MGSNETRNLWLSILFGVFASFLIYSYSQEKKAEYDKKFGAVKTVVIAKNDIRELEIINETMLETITVPAEYIDPNAIGNKEEIVGKVAAVPIPQKQQISKNLLLIPGADTGISNQVALNKRAVSIPVDEVRGIAKLIRPGDRVDIVVALDTGKGVTQRRESIILMQAVEVLATGVSIVNNIPRLMEMDPNGKNITQTNLTGDTKYSTITVEASPKEAQDLIYILSTSPGNIYFTLRNPNDQAAPSRLPSSTVESVLGKASVDSAPMAAPPVFQAPAYVPPQPPQKKSNSSYRRL